MDIKAILIHIEIFFIRIFKFFGYNQDLTKIPKGYYCYTVDNERNKKEHIDGYWFIPCPYFRATRKQGGYGCTLENFVGFDPLLYDQCKICNVNLDDESDK